MEIRDGTLPWRRHHADRARADAAFDECIAALGTPRLREAIDAYLVAMDQLLEDRLDLRLAQRTRRTTPAPRGQTPAPGAEDQRGVG